MYPKIYDGASVDNIEDKELKNFAASWCANPTGNVLLSGPSGVGKTWAAVAMCRAAASRWKYFSVVAELNMAFSRGFGAPNDLLDKLGDQDLLVLDDLGTRPPTDAFLDFLYLLVNQRLNNNLPTLFTTNLNGEQMPERLGNALTSRVCSGKIFSMKGRDLRLKI